MRTRSILLPALLLLATSLSAQYNSKGKLHLSVGGAVGGHATELEQTFEVLGFEIDRTVTGSAATTSVPIEFGYGLSERFSLGLTIEPGSYVPDSASNDQSNSLALFTIQPRYYIVNKDRFAWMASAQLGGGTLRMQDNKLGSKVDERYFGTAVGLGTGIAIGIGGHVGVEFHLRYLATFLELNAREFNGSSTMDLYDADLDTHGLLAQLSLAFRFGGQ